ncbi:hypothetical protein GLYMA_08G049250v4 [Glycine max]|nr:hypothetical protein GLYMA_08G049250v4 [Glycine max]KAH1049680.1 hypothetical protein GYH30_020273 [Glycine max]
MMLFVIYLSVFCWFRNEVNVVSKKKKEEEMKRTSWLFM